MRWEPGCRQLVSDRADDALGGLRFEQLMEEGLVREVRMPARSPDLRVVRCFAVMAAMHEATTNRHGCVGAPVHEDALAEQHELIRQTDEYADLSHRRP